MHDARGVRLGQRFARLQRVLDGVRHRQPALPGQLGREIAALQELHDHERHAGVERAHVEYTAYVFAADLGRGPRFASKALRRALVVEREVGQHELDRHALLQTQMPGSHDQPHTALADDLLDLVLLGDGLADCDGRVLHRGYFGGRVGAKFSDIPKACNPR